MLYHEFSLFDSTTDKEYNMIRISDSFVQKMMPELSKYKFTWSGYCQPQYGLSRDFTIIQTQEVIQLKTCLLHQSHNQREHAKLLKLIDNALENQLGIIHQNGAPGHLVHKFVLCDKVPEQLSILLYRDSCVEIPDQFIRENYDVFKNVFLYWSYPNQTGPGFNYYGTTIITPSMAQLLLDTMARFLYNNSSEMSEYFVGEEYDTLCTLLKKAIERNRFLVHFGI